MLRREQISPNYSAKDYENLAFLNEKDWDKAVDIFEDRIRGLLLKFIEKIEYYQFAGFAAMALDCLLIETLQQFYRGKKQIPIGQSARYFSDFLTKSSFRDFFTKSMAKKFYRQTRCGIFNQSEIIRKSKVNILKNTPLVSFTEDKKGIIINSKLFHKQLKKEFENYMTRLKNPKEVKLRKNFRKKMKYICQLAKEE